MASWRRSRDFHVSADHFELQYAPNPDRAASLAHSANQIIVEASAQFSNEPVSVILTDSEGVVLERRTGDSRLQRHLDRVSLAPGFSYAEEFVGTNGIGTALEGRGPAQVFGHEHYVENLEELACAGAPIHHPTTGKVLGVVDLTCWRADANQMMVAAASTIARRIEEALLEHTGRRELALLQDYLAACQRNRGPVLAISNDLVMLNDAARQLIDPMDQVTLLGLASEALAAGKPSQFSCPLPSGVTARVHCRPSWSDASVIGGVVNVHLFTPVATDTPSVLPTPGPLPGMVGVGALWTTCCQEVETHFRSREWLLLEGEPGTGKFTVARATHLAHTPGGHLRVFNADELALELSATAPAAAAPGDGDGDSDGDGDGDGDSHVERTEAEAAVSRWLDSVREELVDGRGTVILRHVDRLPDDVLDELSALLGLLEASPQPRHGERQWVVATRSSTGPVDGALERLVSRFPHSVVVPPLRHHIDDLRELVPFLIARLTRGASLRCSPDAMRVLMRNRWPGNTEQLYQVIRKVVTHRRTGVIAPTDLPPEVQATSRRVLTPLESIECDAIIACLRGAEGNRAEAARHLGMSRATIYRKIREYGIVVPPSKG
jgi:sigma-54 dependent transcriptional regulator, acetoin dehydrogenase operon transcriptional activator AcoR